MIETLKQGILCSNLTEEQLRRVVRHASKLYLAEGEPLFQQDTSAERFYFLVSGQIKIFRLSPTGNEKVIEIVIPGETIAEAVMFLDKPSYPFAAQSLQAAEVISLDARDFAAMLVDSPDTCLLLLGEMSRRVRGLIGEIDALTLHSATCRVAAYLLSQSPEHGEFVLPASKQVVASRLSVKPETFSRIINQFRSTGVLNLRGRRVSVLDQAVLQTLAKGCSLEGGQRTLALEPS